MKMTPRKEQHPSKSCFLVGHKVMQRLRTTRYPDAHNILSKVYAPDSRQCSLTSGKHKAVGDLRHHHLPGRTQTPGQRTVDTTGNPWHTWGILGLWCIPVLELQAYDQLVTKAPARLLGKCFPESEKYLPAGRVRS